MKPHGSFLTCIVCACLVEIKIEYWIKLLHEEEVLYCAVSTKPEKSALAVLGTEFALLKVLI